MSEYILKAKTDRENAKLELEEQNRMHRDLMEIENAPVSPVHENLLNLRRRNGYNRQEMSELMGVTPRTYYNYELGKRAIPSNILVKLATSTGTDLNTLLMGRAGDTDLKVVKSAFEEISKITSILVKEYPTMTLDDRYEVARFSLTYDWKNWPRMHIEMIREAVKIVTRFRYHPEDLPAPPQWEAFDGNQNAYSRALAEWEQMADEDQVESQLEDIREALKSKQKPDLGSV